MSLITAVIDTSQASVSTTNSTTEDRSPYDIDLDALDIIRTAIYYALLLPFAIIGNAFTIRVSVRILGHRKIPNLLTLALAISDLAGTISVHLPVIISLIAGRWLGDIYMCAYQYLVVWSFLKLSFFILVLMTIDRYLALCKPFYYHSKANSKTVVYAVVFLAAFSFLGTAVTIISHAHTIMMLDTWYMCLNTWNSTDPYYAAILVFYGTTFMIFICVFIFCNVSVVFAMIKRSKDLANWNGRGDSINKRKPAMKLTVREKREKRFAQVIILLSIVFLVSWTPYLVVIVLRQSMLYASDFAEDFVVRLVLANTAFNSIITCAFNKTYKQGFWFFFLAMCNQLTAGIIGKPEDDSMFYLRRSYLQHKVGRRVRTLSHQSVEVDKIPPKFKRKISRNRVTRHAISHVAVKEEHWLIIASKYPDKDFCDNSYLNPNCKLDDEKTPNSQIRQKCHGNEEKEQIRCKLTVDINLDLESSGRNVARTVHLALNLDTMSCETKL